MNGANLTIKALQAFDLLLNIIQWAIILRALLSWFPISKENVFYKILYQITEPILSPIRKLLENTPLGQEKNVLAEKIRRSTNSEFLDPYQRNLLEKSFEICGIQDYFFFGGFSGAERTVVVF